MLVLSRKISETVRVGDNIKITVLGIDGAAVKIGIDAPRSLTIVREELYSQTKKANREALLAPDLKPGAFGVISGDTAVPTDTVE